MNYDNELCIHELLTMIMNCVSMNYNYELWICTLNYDYELCLHELLTMIMNYVSMNY